MMDDDDPPEDRDPPTPNQRYLGWLERKSLAKAIRKENKARRLRRLFKRVSRLEKKVATMRALLKEKGLLNETD